MPVRPDPQGDAPQDHRNAQPLPHAQTEVEQAEKEEKAAEVARKKAEKEAKKVKKDAE